MSMDPERNRRARKWVWGCTGGCLGAIVIVGVAIYLVASHFMQAMPIVPPQTFLTRDTSAFVFARIDSAVPLTMETAQDVAQRPEVAKIIADLSGTKSAPNRESEAAFITTVGPLQGVVTLQTEGRHNAIHGGLALSIRSGSRVVSLLARTGLKPPLEFSPYQGTQIARLREGAYMALRDNNYMSSDREELLKTWAVHLEQEHRRAAQAAADGRVTAPPLNISPPLRRAYDRLDASLPFVFACLNTHHELASLASLISDQDARRIIEATGIASDGVLSLAGEIKPLGSRDAELTLFIDCADAAFAAQMKDAIERVAREAGTNWPLTDTAVETTDDTTLVVKGRIDNLPAKVADMAAAVLARAQKAQEKAAPAEEAAPAPQV